MSRSIDSRNDSSPKSEVVHETHSSFEISYVTHVWLVQLDRHQSKSQEVTGSVPNGGNFFTEFILLLPAKAFICNIANFV